MPPPVVSSPVSLKGRRILLVDDEESIRFGVGKVLERHGARVATAGSAAQALVAAREEMPDLVLLDMRLPDGDGVDVLNRILAERPETRVVLMTGYGTIERAVSAIRTGAEDFLTKPVDVDHLLHVLSRVSEAARMASRNAALLHELEGKTPAAFWGESEPMRDLLAQAKSAAESDALVVLTGESGTGKGLLARQIHEWSARKGEAFVNVNCAGLHRELLESELFGHEKGAFTGAAAAKPGLFELADRGTLFLDEVGEIDLSLQPRLLKAVEEQRFHRVGGTVERRVNVRVLAASNRHLPDEVKAGRFRADLFYRLSVLELRLPALRERTGDVVPLARLLLSRFTEDAGRAAQRFEVRAERLLVSYDWPGNVRELRNVMERVSILGPRGAVPAELLARFIGLPVPATPSETVEMSAAAPARKDGRLETLEEREKAYIIEILAATGGNKSAAAEILGVTRNTLYNKLKAWGISTPAGEE